MNPYYEHFRVSAEHRPSADYYKRFKTTVGGGVPPEDIGSVYRSILHQQGYGLRNFNEVQGLGFWSDLWAMGRPLMHEGLRYFGAKAVDTASNIAQDAINGKNVKDAIETRFKEAKHDVIAKVPGAVKGAVRNLFAKDENMESALMHKENRKRRRPTSHLSPGILATAARSKRRKIVGQGIFPALEYF